MIPQVLRRNYLSQLHDSHQGIARTREPACLWPLIDKDIEDVVRACMKCEKSLLSCEGAVAITL